MKPATLIIPISILLLTISISESSQGSHPVPYGLSPVYLEYLENVESQIYHQLKKSDFLSEGHSILERYVVEYENSISGSKNNDSVHDISVSHNPILSLQMMYRFMRYFKDKSFASVAKDILQHERVILPGRTEIEDALDGLLRLQHIYDLDSNQISEGILDGVGTGARMSIQECYELGKFAHDSGYYTLALQWYDTILSKLKTGKDVQSVPGLNSNFISKAMKEVVEEHNLDYNESLEDGDMYIFSAPIHTTNYSEIAHLTLRRRVAEELTGHFLEEKDPQYYESIEANLMALCHGQSLKSEREKSRLKCWLDTMRHPYWAINPLKIELLHETPQIIQLYDIFSNKWNNHLRDLSYSELERAPQPEDATPRTAAYAWFEDKQIPNLPISQTIEFITDLNVRGVAAAESLQVAAYAFGGHVDPHYDSRGPNDTQPNSRGDRVTTFLVYLSEVERGGLTAFPLLGFHVKPVKNSAVLWYTNLKNGDIDDRTLHAACPVISGQKWIATKWTHINSNVFKRPCGLKPDE